MARLSDHVARNIAAERARRRWKQEELAERLGWGRSTISAVETGARRASIDDLPALCRALDVTLGQLLAGADTEDLRALGL